MRKIRNKLNKEEKRAFDYLLNAHDNKKCECSLSDAETVVMCPIALFKDGCTEEQFISEIKAFAEAWKDEDFIRE